jgi:hypothetical protein
MYENVQSSLNLRSEQRFSFISPYLENPVYFINYYNKYGLMMVAFHSCVVVVVVVVDVDL